MIKKQSYAYFEMRPIMNTSDVAEVEVLSEPEFPHHANSATIYGNLKKKKIQVFTEA